MALTKHCKKDAYLANKDRLTNIFILLELKKLKDRWI